MQLCRGFGGLPSEHLWEILQQNKTLHVIKMNFVKKCLEMFAEIAELNVDYRVSDEQFGKCLKLVTHEDSTIRAKIAELHCVRASVGEGPWNLSGQVGSHVSICVDVSVHLTFMSIRLFQSRFLFPPLTLIDHNDVLPDRR